MNFTDDDRLDRNYYDIDLFRYPNEKNQPVNKWWKYLHWVMLLLLGASDYSIPKPWIL